MISVPNYHNVDVVHSFHFVIKNTNMSQKSVLNVFCDNYISFWFQTKSKALCQQMSDTNSDSASES